MEDSITLQCRCGKVRGTITGISKINSKRIVCLCSDCQAFAHHLGRSADVLEPSGGTDIYPAYPAHVTFTQGTEQLKCLRLTRQGLLRWYADCCKTPVANCPPNPGVPYVGIIHSIMNHAADGTTADAKLGPIHARIMGKSGIKPLPPGTYEKAPVNVILMAVRVIGKGYILRKQKPTFFFDEASGKPRVTPYVLTPEERDRLRKVCGPR